MLNPQSTRAPDDGTRILELDHSALMALLKEFDNHFEKSLANLPDMLRCFVVSSFTTNVGQDEGSEGRRIGGFRWPQMVAPQWDILEAIQRRDLVRDWVQLFGPLTRNSPTAERLFLEGFDGTNPVAQSGLSGTVSLSELPRVSKDPKLLRNAERFALEKIDATEEAMRLAEKRADLKRQALTSPSIKPPKASQPRPAGTHGAAVEIDDDAIMSEMLEHARAVGEPFSVRDFVLANAKRISSRGNDDAKIRRLQRKYKKAKRLI